MFHGVRRGFTIIEMLVVIGIIAIFATYTVLNLTGNRPERVVEAEAEKFYSNLLYTRNIAVSGTVFKDEDVPSDGETDVPNGYGLYFIDSFNYLAYGDLYNSGAPKTYDAGTEETSFGPFSIDGDVSVNFFNWFSGLPDTAATHPANIFFESEFGLVTIDGNVSIDDTSMGFKVQFFDTSDPSLQKTVYINKSSGQIYVQ